MTNNREWSNEISLYDCRPILYTRAISLAYTASVLFVHCSTANQHYNFRLLVPRTVEIRHIKHIKHDLKSTSYIHTSYKHYVDVKQIKQ